MRAIGPMQRPDDAASLLALYLRDHDGASAGGVRLVERCRHSNAGTSFAAPLADLAVEITQDQAQLRGIMHDLDITPSRVKRTAAWVAANLGELVPNGRLVAYSPLSRVLELEALSSAVMAKLRLWHALGELASRDGRLEQTALEGLHERGVAQMDTLAALHAMAVDLAFTQPGNG